MVSTFSANFHCCVNYSFNNTPHLWWNHFGTYSTSLGLLLYLLAYFVCMFMCVWLTRFLCIRSPSSVHRERVPLWQPALHSWPLGLRPWQRLRGQFWRERLRWVKEKKRQQKGKTIKRGMERAVALATMFNIIIQVFLLQIGPQWVISQCNYVPGYLVNDLQDVCIIHSPWSIERVWLYSLWMNVFQSYGPVTRVTSSAVVATASLSASNATATLTVLTSLMKAPVVSVLPCFFFFFLSI